MMSQSAQLAIHVGAMANLALALWRALALQRIERRPPVVADRNPLTHPSAILTGYRQVFTLLIFGAVPLLHAETMITTPIGFTLAVAIALFLLLKAFEHLFVPELRRAPDYVDLSLSLLGATFYGWAAALNTGV